MTKIFAGVFLVLSIVGCTMQVGGPDDTTINKELVNRLMGWIEHETGYKASIQPIVVASREKFQQVMRLNGNLCGHGRALYIPGMVVLNNENGWEHNDRLEVSLLLHELVHHAQLFSKREYPCKNSKEYEAYTLQNKWLAQQGERPFASQAWIKKMSDCKILDSVGQAAEEESSSPQCIKNEGMWRE